MTPAIDAVALLPELLVTALLVAVLIADLIGGRVRTHLHLISAIGLMFPLGVVFVLGATERYGRMMDGGYIVDEFSLLAKGVFVAAAAIVFLIGPARSWKGEYCVLILASVLGMVMIASARELLTFFVAFELLAVPGYMLAGWNKRSEHGHEAALKYYLLGVISTAVLLYGISLLYGIAGSTRFSDVAVAVDASNGGQALVSIAVLFVLVGMAFKVSAVPFHFWAPDAYQGAPISVAAFLSVATKAGGIVALLTLVVVALPDSGSVWSPMLWALAALTMTVGNLLALRQTDIVRLLAYSSIAQAGFMLVPLGTAGLFGGKIDEAVTATMEYLIVYSVANLGAFAVVATVARRFGGTSIETFSGLFGRAPGLAVLLSIFLLSLAGIPPFGGWFAKLVVFRAAINADSPEALTLAVVAAANAALSLVYYAVVVRQMWMKPVLPESIEVAALTPTRRNSSVAALGLCAIGVIITGVLPGVVTYFGELSSLSR